MKLELIDHPATTVDENGERVPAVPHMRAVKANGKVVGYCHAEPGFPVTLTYWMNDDERAEVATFVEKEVGGITKVTAPPSPSQIERMEEYLETGVDINDDDEDEESDEPDDEE